MVDLPYRLWFVREITFNFSPPLAAVFLGLHYLERHAPVAIPQLGPVAKALVYLFSVPVAAFLRRTALILYYSYRSWKLGVPQAPELRGKRIGNLDLLDRFIRGMGADYPGEAFDELFDEAGSDTVRMSFLWTPDKVITRDQDVVKFMLSTGFSDFWKGPTQRMCAAEFLGKGIFTADGDDWKFHRSLARPHFSRDRISDYEIFVKYTDKLLHFMKRPAERGEPIDVQEMFARFTLDTAGEFLFGTSDLNTLELPLPKAGHAALGKKGAAMSGTYGDFVTAFEEAQMYSLARAASPTLIWTAKEFFHNKLSGTQKAIDAYLSPLIRRALDNKRSEKPEGEAQPQSFLDHLAASTDDMQVIKDQLLSILLAARDTTASLLSFTCYMLAKHPHVMQKLKEEVSSRLEDSTHPSYDDLKQLKYLRAVLNETLRLFPPVPINGRSARGETIIPTRQGGIFIPAYDTHVFYSLISIQRRSDLWGEDADEFDPERWLDHRSKDTVADPFRFTPFNAGPRICLGQQFAYNEASYVMVRLVQTFESFSVAQAEAAPPGCLPPASWESAKGRKGMDEVALHSAVTLYAKGGMWLRMNPV